MRSMGSLGVGIQSSALYYMSSMGILPKLDLLIFADTGGEKTKTLEYWDYLLEWQKENNGIPLYKANYKNLQKDLLNQLNSSGNRFAPIPAFTMNNEKKGMLRRQCTNEYKIAQLNKKYREILEIGNKRFPLTEIWIGISSEERDRMTIPQEKWKVNVYPFCGYKIYPDGHNERIGKYIKTRSGIINWLKENNLPVPEKSSCKFCPFQSDYNWKRLKDNTPDDFEDACKVDESIRDCSKRGIASPLYLHRSLKPLREIEFNEKQQGFFDDLGNCTDACDV